MSALFNLFYLYDPWLFHFFRMAFFCGGLVCIYLAIRFYQKRQDILVPMDSLLAILGLIAFSVMPLLINGTKEVGVLSMYIKSLLLFVLGIGLYNVFYRTQQGKNRFIQDIKIGIIIQFAIGVVALFGVQWVIDLALSTNVVMPRFYGSEQEYRLYNLTSSAFFQLSLFYLILLHFLLAYDNQKNDLNPIYLFLLLCIGLISGRTFLMLSIMSLLIYFKRKYIPALLAFALLTVSLALFMPENKYVAHALEPLINLLTGAGRLSSSTDTLMKNHLFMPSLSQFIRGDGYYFQDGHYYGLTDSGFLRQILYGGVGYLFVCTLLTFYFVKRVAENWFNHRWKFILSTFLLLTICNIKADTYSFPGLMMIFLMFVSLFGTSGKTKVFARKGNEDV